MKTALATLFGITAALMVIATVLPLIRSEHWWIRVFDFPRLQVVVVSVVVFVLWLVVWDSRSVWQDVGLAILAIAIVFQMSRIRPYTALAAPQARDVAPGDTGGTLTLMTVNVLQDNREADRLSALVREIDPDLVLVIEPDDWWDAQLTWVSETRPHVVSRPLDNTYGMILYSRWPLSNTTVRELTREGIPSIRTDIAVPGGDPVRFYGLHPPPPVPGLAKDSAARDAELVLVAREVRDRRGPILVAGDLNDVAWSRTTEMFQRISRLLDPRIGRGMFNSFHAGKWYARWPLDHVFFSDDFALVSMQRLPDIGSDHFPILVSLALPEAPPEHREPGAVTESLRDLADEKLEAAGVAPAQSSDVRTDDSGRPH